MPLDQFPLWKWRDGDRYCLRLSDVGMFRNSANKITAQGYYNALFEITRHPGQTVIQLNLQRKFLAILSRRRPILTVQEL